MSLQSTGDLLIEPDGYYLRASDGERRVLFALPERVAIEALDFDVHSSELLERHLRDRMPEIWDACRNAYELAVGQQEDNNLRIMLTEEHFRPS
ncbi:MAG: hypothetical protein E6Q98_23890 [Rhodospirillaceae bacterium]|jgi:hypothetical protein|nr:MAG: hypothetical protein E6Q98_23890 [Rhodospirillaceae bacterium]